MGLKLPRGLVFGLFALALLPACSDNTTDAEYLEQARQSRAAGEFNAAVIQLKSALQLNPDNYEARYLLGSIYLEGGRLSDAEKEFQKAAEIDNTRGGLQVPLASSLFGQGKYNQLLEQVAPRDDNDADTAAEVFSYRSRSWLALGDLNRADMELAQAKRLAPDKLPTLIAEVHLAAQSGDVAKSREQIQAVLAQVPDSAEAWTLLGSLEYSSGALDAANEAFSKAIESRENNTLDHLKRAMTRIALGDYDGAKEDIAVARAKAPESAVTLYAEGLLDFRQERYPEAQAAFEKALNRSPDYMEVVFYLGATHLAQEHLSQAEFNLQRFVTAFPESKPAVSLLALTHNKLGNPDRTLDLLKPALQGPNPDAQFLTLAGEAYLIKKDVAAAASLLDEAADQMPDAGKARMMAGLAQLQAGDEAAGVKSLETAASLGNEYRTNIALGYYYLNTGQLDKSLETVTTLENLHPDDPRVYDMKARVYIQMNDYGLARSNFEKALSLDASLVPASLSLAALDLQENNIPAARDRYKAILEQDNKNTAAMIGLADLSRQEGKEEDYLKWVERAVKANPSAIMPRIYQVNDLLQRGDNAAALRVAQEAVTLNPDKTIALALLGKVQLTTGEAQGALNTFTKLAALAPESAMALDQLARAYAANGDVSKARETLRKALESDPEYLNAISALATLEIVSRQPEAALAQALRYQQLSPGSSTGLMLEGDARMAARENKEAAAAYRKALALEPQDARVVIKLHIAELRLDNADAADKAILAWLAANPDSESARSYLALSFLKRGLDEQAMRQYVELTQRSPGNAMAFNNLAFLYQRAGNAKALATARTAHRLSPDNPDIADTLGWILVEQGEVASGIELIKQAVAADTSDPERQYHLAYALARDGQADQASKLVSGLLKMPLSPELKAQVTRLSEQLASR